MDPPFSIFGFCPPMSIFSNREPSPTCPKCHTTRTSRPTLDRARPQTLALTNHHESQVEEEAHAPLETQTQKDAPALQVIAPPMFRTSVDRRRASRGVREDPRAARSIRSSSSL
jgi:hypothetical protein